MIDFEIQRWVQWEWGYSLLLIYSSPISALANCKLGGYRNVRHLTREGEHGCQAEENKDVPYNDWQDPLCFPCRSYATWMPSSEIRGHLLGRVLKEQDHFPSVPEVWQAFWHWESKLLWDTTSHHSSVTMELWELLKHPHIFWFCSFDLSYEIQHTCFWGYRAKPPIQWEWTHISIMRKSFFNSFPECRENVLSQKYFL